MTTRDDDLRVRPGRIQHGNRAGKRPQTFVGEVMRAAKKAGHAGNSFHSSQGRSRSQFGRGRRAAVSIRLRSNARRVVMKARVVRHQGTRFRSAPMPKHITYLKREGVTRDGENARMFDAASDTADERAFAERCEDDRHHFRFIISPEDGAELGDLKTFTRELMQDVEKDLGTKIDWVGVDHWNTDNPHVHVLIRGRADDGQDLVISREYISRGFRDRAAERVTLELGPRSEQEIRTALEREVNSERWTSLDRALRDISDECGGVADLRPGPNAEDPELRNLLLGRAAKLERLGLAEPVGPACWTLKPGLDQTLRQLSIRGDIIKTMHQAMSAGGREPDVSTFALHGDEPSDPVLGRLVKRGLDDELKGTAYAIVAGVDGRTHHLKFSDLEMTGDAPAGAIVEARAYDDAKGHRRLSLATRSDFAIEAQVTASGATWLDRQLLAKDPPLSGGGFGAEVRDAMDARIDHLAAERLAHRQGQRVVFARDLLATLRRRELDDATSKLSAEIGLAHQPSTEGEHVAGVYRQRVTLAAGRFAMIEVAKTGDRVVLIEDTRELQCAAPNLVALRTKDGAASLSDLVRSALRLRPDRIPIGEVRGAEALDLLKAWGTGHPGGVGTLHAGSAIGALRRLEQLIQEAVVTVPRALIAETIDLIAVLAGRGSARRLAELAAVKGLGPTGDYVLSPAGES